MISTLGYLAVFLLVLIVLYRIFANLKGILVFCFLGAIAYFVTNYYLLDKDMTEQGVIDNGTKIMRAVDRVEDAYNKHLNAFLSNGQRLYEEIEAENTRKRNKGKPVKVIEKEEPEGFVVNE